MEEETIYSLILGRIDLRGNFSPRQWRAVREIEAAQRQYPPLTVQFGESGNYVG